MLMIVTMMLLLVLMRQVELQVLVALGVYKNVENMTDKEMIDEYEKLKKQSRKMQKRIERQKQGKNTGARSSYTSIDSDADTLQMLTEDSASRPDSLQLRPARQNSQNEK